jgi:hypothetical protein
MQVGCGGDDVPAWLWPTGTTSAQILIAQQVDHIGDVDVEVGAGARQVRPLPRPVRLGG